MRTYTVQGIILKRKNIGEADRILTVFTKEFGKMRVLAKSVRKIASRRASHIEPLTLTSLTIYAGSAMPILTEATSLEHFSLVKSDLKKLAFAYHICELIDGLCPENQESEKIFDMIQQMLHTLTSSSNVGEHIHAFEVELLSILGYWSDGNGDLKGAKASYFIETILERKLKTRQLLPLLLS